MIFFRGAMCSAPLKTDCVKRCLNKDLGEGFGLLSAEINDSLPEMLNRKIRIFRIAEQK